MAEPGSQPKTLALAPAPKMVRESARKLLDLYIGFPAEVLENPRASVHDKLDAWWKLAQVAGVASRVEVGSEDGTPIVPGVLILPAEEMHPDTTRQISEREAALKGNGNGHPPANGDSNGHGNGKTGNGGAGGAGRPGNGKH